jgi:GR25 family glycosyltransferase involved in LPS biosynthesis
MTKRWISLFFLVIISQLYGYRYSYITPLVKYLKPIEIAETESGVEGVDCIYVINLDERPEKWERMQKICSEQGLKVNRVSGINGWKLDDGIIAEISGSYPLEPIKGKIGCILSHLSVMKDAFDRQFNMIWIMEDDVDFLESVEKIPPLLKELSKIDRDWDIFYTDIDFRNAKGEHVPSVDVCIRPDQYAYSAKYYRKRKIINREIMQIHQRFGMHSVIISHRGLKKIIDYFSHVYYWSPIDVDIHYIPGIRQYSPTRDIIANWIGSPISDTVSGSSLKENF